MGQTEEAIASLNRAQRYNPEATWPSDYLAVAYAHLGRLDEAREAYRVQLKSSREWGFSGGLLRREMFWEGLKDPEFESYIAKGYLKAGVPGEIDDYYASRIFLEPKLSEDELKDAVFDHTVTGFDFRSREEWSIKRHGDGQALYSREGFSDVGRSWIEDDRLCNQWQHLYGGLKDCAPVFRNPKSTAEQKDEYIGISAYGFVPFKVEN